MSTKEKGSIIQPKLNKRSVSRSCAADKKFWISIRRAKDCLFSRRNGYVGKVIFGWSVCIRLFGRNCH